MDSLLQLKEMERETWIGLSWLRIRIFYSGGLVIAVMKLRFP
jgi:hypothetical protein